MAVTWDFSGGNILKISQLGGGAPVLFLSQINHSRSVGNRVNYKESLHTLLGEDVHLFKTLVKGN